MFAIFTLLMITVITFGLTQFMDYWVEYLMAEMPEVEVTFTIPEHMLTESWVPDMDFWPEVLEKSPKNTSNKVYITETAEQEFFGITIDNLGRVLDLLPGQKCINMMNTKERLDWADSYKY